MSRFLLDTNIVSDAAKPAAPAALVAWLSDQPDENLFISSWTIAEIWRGILKKPAGRKREDLERWFGGPDGPQALFVSRVLPFDERAALMWAELLVEGEKKGRPRNPFDMIIAAVARANNCIVVTGNEKHFTGLPVFNPARAR